MRCVSRMCPKRPPACDFPDRGVDAVIYLLVSGDSVCTPKPVCPGARKSAYAHRRRRRHRLPASAGCARHTSARGWPNGLTRPEVASVADSSFGSPRGETQDPGQRRGRAPRLWRRGRGGVRPRRGDRPGVRGGRRPRTSPGVVVADIDVAGDPSDPSASAPPFPPSAASTAPIPADVADFARRALRHRLARSRRSHSPTITASATRRSDPAGRRIRRPSPGAAGSARSRRSAPPQRSTTGPSSASPTASSIAAVRPRRRYRERLRGRRPGIPDRLGHRRPRDGRGGLRPQRPRTDLTRDPRGRRQRVSRDRRGDRL